MKKLMGVIRLIPRSIVAPTWHKGEEHPTVPLHLENRGTETIVIEAGQTMAKLEELQLHEGGSDDIISLEDLEAEGLCNSTGEDG